MKKDLKQLIHKNLIVSCQAVDDEPLNNPIAISLMAKACVEGGATVLRVSQVEHIAIIQQTVDVPLIGLIKQHYDDSSIFITPTCHEAQQLMDLGVAVIALDATNRPRPNGETLEQVVQYIRQHNPEQLIMADCATLEECLYAEQLGFDFISTTLRGYTENTIGCSNLADNYAFPKLVAKSIKHSAVIIEGGVWTPQQVHELLAIDNVYAVVVGSAITRPQLITKYFFENI